MLRGQVRKDSITAAITGNWCYNCFSNNTGWQRQNHVPVLLENGAAQPAHALHHEEQVLNPPVLRKSLALIGNLEGFFPLVPLTTDLHGWL